MSLDQAVAQKDYLVEHMRDPKSRIFVQRHRLKEYRKALKYISVVAMLGAIVIVAAIALGHLLTGASNGFVQLALLVLAVLVAGGLILRFSLIVTIGRIEADLEAAEDRLQDEQRY